MTTSYLYQSERLRLPNSLAVTVVENHTDGTSITWAYPQLVFILSLMSYIIVLVMVPLLDLIVHPCAWAYAPSIIVRVGIGLCFAFCSSATALATESVRFYFQNSLLPTTDNCSNYNVIQPLYNGSITWYCSVDFPFLSLLPQFIFLGFAEAFINIGGTVCIYKCVCFTQQCTDSLTTRITNTKLSSNA